MFGRNFLGSLFVIALFAIAECPAQPGPGAGAPSGPSNASFEGQLPPPYAGSPSSSGGNGRTIFEEIPDDRGWLFEGSPLSKAVENSFRHAFFRTEYLTWSFEPPGRVVLGENRLVSPGEPFSFGDPRVPFDATDPATNVTRNGFVPTMDSYNPSGNNGFRGTFGMPVGPGALEVSAFVFQKSNLTQDLTKLMAISLFGLPETVGLPSTAPIFIAQPVLVGGSLSKTSLVYTDTYRSALQTGVWGVEANYVFSPPNLGSGDPFTICPIAGFRYFDFQETLNQSGVYKFSTDGGVTTTDVLRRIDDSTFNHSYGPQIGLRTEVNFARLTIGAEPKIMLGLNSYTANLQTANIISPTEAPLRIRDDGTTFSPLADVKVYSRLSLTQNLGVFVSYNALWEGQVTRPFDNIVYNTTAGGAANDFKQNVTETDVVLQGMSFGAELRY